jgi:hypothetical protein
LDDDGNSCLSVAESGGVTSTLCFKGAKLLSYSKDLEGVPIEKVISELTKKYGHWTSKEPNGNDGAGTTWWLLTWTGSRTIIVLDYLVATGSGGDIRSLKYISRHFADSQNQKEAKELNNEVNKIQKAQTEKLNSL